MKKSIAILLPYKEKYTVNKAGAASIWVSDYLKKSALRDKTTVFGNLQNNEKPLTKNFVNLNITNLIYKKNLQYTDTFYNKIKNTEIKIVEIHNRPESLVHLIKKDKNLKKIFFFHNNPIEMRNSKTTIERKFILDNTDQIYFVSKWVKDKFFSDLDVENKNNCNIMYPAIDPIRTFPKKNNVIIFTGKLNSSKGYHLFGTAVTDILKKHKNWKALAIGNEPREKLTFKHKNFKTLDWIPHKKILNYYKKSSISVVPSQWEEPFGRTAMESAACGCATIISNRGGLPETINNPIKLIKLNTKNIFNEINKLIKNKKKLKIIQKNNFLSVKHKLSNLVTTLDEIKKSFLIEKRVFLNKNALKILHIANFDQKTNHRLFNISVAHKISSGMIRNGHDVINFSYRDYSYKDVFKKMTNIDEKILDICNNYKPDLLVCGHNNILNEKTLMKLKDDGSKICVWYEDHIAKGGPNFNKNLQLIEKNKNLIDQYFVTTSPEVVKTDIAKNKMNFMPIPADKNIENLKIYEIKNRYKDLFFALSHGVNYGKLKKNNKDERGIFISELMNSNQNINYNILGLNNEEPKWNYNYYKEMMNCKMALNLSRGNPLKYASSNRISTLMANGILTFIDKKICYEDFFNDDQMCFYENVRDLSNQLDNLKGNIKKINKISKNGKRRYFEIFNNSIVSDYIVSKTLDTKPSFKYIWDK